MPATASSRSASASMAGATRRKPPRPLPSARAARPRAPIPCGDGAVRRARGARELARIGVVGEHRSVAEPSVERAVAVEHVRIAARHARTEVQPDVAEHDHRAGGHVLAAVIPDAFDDGHCPGVADGEALARGARAEELATARAVEHRVADEARLAHVVGRRGDHDPPPLIALPTPSFASPTRSSSTPAVRNAPKLCPAEPSKRARTRPGGGDDLAARAIAPPSRAPTARSPFVIWWRGSTSVALDRGPALGVEQDAQPVARVRGRAWVKRVVPPRCARGAGEVEAVDDDVARSPLREALHAPDGVVERAEPERREQAAHLLGDEQEVGLHHLRRSAELLAQLRPLGRDADGAAVEVARAHHETALREQERRAERVLVGTEQGRDDDVAPGLEAPVGAKPHAAAQVVRDERLLRLRQPELPGTPALLIETSGLAPVPPSAPAMWMTSA